MSEMRGEEIGTGFGSVTMKKMIDPDLMASQSQNYADQILGEQNLKKALVKDMVRKIRQHQKRSDMKTGGEM